MRETHESIGLQLQLGISAKDGIKAMRAFAERGLQLFARGDFEQAEFALMFDAAKLESKNLDSSDPAARVLASQCFSGLAEASSKQGQLNLAAQNKMTASFIRTIGNAPAWNSPLRADSR